jgi:hypothetical protein
VSAAWQVVVYLLAVVCFVLAAAGVNTVRHPIGLGWLGLALVTLVPLVAAFQAL